MSPITDHELQLEDVPEQARPHFEKELAEMTHAEKIVRRFHQYLRNRTSIGSGTVVDYVKAAVRIFVENEDPRDVPNADATIRQMKRMTELRRKNGERGE